VKEGSAFESVPSLTNEAFVRSGGAKQRASLFIVDHHHDRWPLRTMRWKEISLLGEGIQSIRVFESIEAADASLQTQTRLKNFIF
jgi:hypothetical protein